MLNPGPEISISCITQGAPGGELWAPKWNHLFSIFIFIFSKIWCITWILPEIAERQNPLCVSYCFLMRTAPGEPSYLLLSAWYFTAIRLDFARICYIHLWATFPLERIRFDFVLIHSMDPKCCRNGTDMRGPKASRNTSKWQCVERQVMGLSLPKIEYFLVNQWFRIHFGSISDPFRIHFGSISDH